MSVPNFESPVALKWRNDDEAEMVTCWLAPVDEPDLTDEWLPILCVSLQVVDDDRELYEDLVRVTSDWMKRIFAEAGCHGIEMIRFPGGLPPMEGAS